MSCTVLQDIYKQFKIPYILILQDTGWIFLDPGTSLTNETEGWIRIRQTEQYHQAQMQLKITFQLKAASAETWTSTGKTWRKNGPKTRTDFQSRTPDAGIQKAHEILTRIWRGEDVKVLDVPYL